MIVLERDRSESYKVTILQSHPNPSRHTHVLERSAFNLTLHHLCHMQGGKAKKKGWN